LTHEEVARALSKSRSAITNALRLLDLPPVIQGYVEAGKLTAGHARAILSVQGDDAREALAQKVVAEGLSVRQTEILGPLFSVKNETSDSRVKETPQSFKKAAAALRGS
jgi:ParB family chromosome partitioning protein